MHMMFTEEEKEWIDMRTFGWPIKNGCPKEIRESIERKKRKIDSQKVSRPEDNEWRNIVMTKR